MLKKYEAPHVVFALNRKSVLGLVPSLCKILVEGLNMSGRVVVRLYDINCRRYVGQSLEYPGSVNVHC